MSIQMSEINTEQKSESMGIRLLLSSYVLGAVGMVFSVVSWMPALKGLKPSWAQYQRFSDLFVWGLAFGVAALVLAFFAWRRDAGFNKVFGAWIVAGFAVAIAGSVGVSVFGELHS